MAEHDLTQTIIPYLDRHLAFPLLAHLVDSSLFPVEQVQLAQYELARGTNMVDYTVQLFQQLFPNEPISPEFSRKRELAVSTNERLAMNAQAVLDVIQNPSVAQSLRQDKLANLQYLQEHYQLTAPQITALYTFGHFQYTYGNYSGAADYLYHFRVLSTDSEKGLSACWGKLACDILTGKWEVALEELTTLRDMIDARALAAPLLPPTPMGAAPQTLPPLPADGAQPPALAQLHSRTWLVHWALFVYFNHADGRTLLLETFLSPSYLNTIQTSCPWILRYLAAAAILARSAPSSTSSATPAATKTTPRNHAHILRDVVRVVKMEEYQYQDPVTAFLRELYVEFDFEAAQHMLGEAEKVVAEDFFLGEFREEFLDCARYLVSEVYCRIHQKIDIADLSERLNLSRDDGEKWIVNLIRETRMGADAKIDLEKNVIQINRPALPIYQTIIEKTRGLAMRTQAMSVAMARGGGGGGGGSTFVAPGASVAAVGAAAQGKATVPKEGVEEQVGVGSAPVVAAAA